MATTFDLPTAIFQIRGTFSNDDALAPASVPLSLQVALTLAAGAGAGKAQQIGMVQYSIAALATQSVDLSGSLKNPLNQTILFTKVKFIIVYLHASPAAVSILTGVPAANPFINWIKSFGTITTDLPGVRTGNGPTGGLFINTREDSTGFAVTAGTGDLLAITNEDAALAATVDVVVIGEGTAS